MKIRQLLLTAITLLLMTNCTNAQSTFDSQWKEFDENISKRLPESAGKVLDQIEALSAAEKNDVQLLKVAVKRSEVFQLNSENVIDTTINYCKAFLPKLSDVSQAILKIEIAKMYNEYSYKFKYNSDEIEGQYLSAFENVRALKKTSMSTYKPLFENENARFDVDFEPTAYDYIAHCVLDFYDDDLDEYLEKYNDLYAQLIGFDNDKKYSKASAYNKINQIESLVDYYHDKEHDTLYFNELNNVLKGCKDNVTIARIKSSQANIMMREENYVEALRLCDEVIAMDSISDDYSKCVDCRRSILDNSVSIEMQNVQVPGKPIPAGFSYRNTTNPSYRIYKVDAKDITNNRNSNLEEILKLLTFKEIVAEETLKIPAETDYKTHSSLIALPALEVGSYIMLVSANDDFDNTDKLIFNVFQVSNLTYVVHNFDGKNEIYTLNRETGSPIGGVKAEFFKEEYDYKKGEYIQKSKGSVTTDSEGYAVMPDISTGFIINLFSGDDILLSHDLIWNNNAKQGNFRKQVRLFTDRQIYRPGQTVQFKGICTRGNGKTNELLVNEKIDVKLLDANYQTVEKQSFVTDDFGAFSGSFVLPSDALNGDFRITTNDGSVYFKVEEYKRPTFEVTFNKPEKEYSIGDNVRVTGNVMAFSGFGIDNAKYEYTIMRQTTFPFRCWWWIFRNIEDEQIASGDGITEAGGLFDIDFQLIPDNSVKARELPMFTYIINVKVTDAQGETHEDSYSINASYNKFNIALKTNPELSSNSGNVLTSDDLNDCKIVVSNISGNPASTNVKCKIYKIIDNERFTCNLGSFDRHLLKDEELKSLFPEFDFYNDGNFDLKNCEVVYENVLKVDGEADLFKKNTKLSAGNYVIELKSVDDTLSEYSEKFVFYEPRSKKMPFKNLCWSAIDSETAQPGDEVNLYIGSSADNVMAIVYVMNNENIRYTERIMLNDNVKRISFNVKEEDRGNLVFDAVFVKHNQKQEVSYNVAVPFDNLKLGVELNAERTNLLPGAEERWSVTIRDYKKNPVFASLLAGMYDSSLDAIVPSYYGNSWRFNMTPTYRKSGDFKFDGGFGSNHASLYSYYYSFFFSPAALYSDVALIQMFGSPKRNIMYKGVQNAAPTAGMADGMVYDFAVEEEAAEAEAPSAAVQDDADGDGNQIEKENTPFMQVRSNFNETAFFYPNLKTDENGDATFTFTMPDALTRWKLRMFAYTKDLKVGTLEETFVTQKPVMIMADMPRFCYDEDTLWLVANVVNLSDETISPVAMLEVFDESGVLRVESEVLRVESEVLRVESGVVLSEKEVKIEEIPAGRSQSVRWKVAMKKDVNLLTFRFSATAGNFSDAEQHIMPVLSTEVFMTQTFPLIAKGNEKKNYNFNFENEGERNHAITLNISKNPTWYAVQALPYLENGNERYAETAFHRYFTNSVAKYVASSLKDSPEMKRLLESLENDSANTAMSELEKNQELKEILLNETPWVLDAKNEAEQRANISKLFDTKAIDKNIKSALNVLKKKQKPSGGWPWVEGMPESALVTQYILGGLGRLESLTKNKNADAIAEKAFHFIENDVVKRFSDLKESDRKDYHCSVMIVRELFVMSYFPKFKTNEKFNEARAFYIGKLKNDWTDFNFEAQAGIALILNRNGDKAEAMAILKSLRECAQKNELGMYWVGIGVEDEARILEAFNEIDPENEEIDAMRFWILGQKRTNMWDNDRATAEAVYAIVNRGTDWVNDNGEVTITISGEKVDLHDGEAGAGFVKKTLPVDGDYSNVSIDNQTNHQVWGGMFRQYFVPIDKVRKSNEDMKVRRELFVERTEGDKTDYVPVSGENIKVGDKIKIVLHIENQQDMEFVYLKDLRGACFEPTEQISRYHHSDGLWYYQSTSDVAMEFFFDNMPKGRHELSHTVYVTKEGSFSAGYAVIQCQYAPEFGAYSKGSRIEIQDGGNH
ncbi:MAG: MG2 domain-containing protein [Bacteroidales bacterium]|nr:MG2 domain-containing protein [Bacteroidales bacterium]